MEPSQNGVHSRTWTCVFLLLVLVNTVDEGQSFPVNITILDSAVAKGAVCLDGSAPAYHFHKGYGSGVNNWLVHLQGGGWCDTVASCKARSNTVVGSSTHMKKVAYFNGILHNRSEFNPYFYNWNRIKVRYCDGSSLTGDVEEVDPETNLHFRGSRILKAVVDDLLANGMKDADRIILSGCSAGGLGTILNCDNFKAMMPSSSTVKCVADAGFFVDVKDISGHETIEPYYDRIVNFHGSAKNLPRSCTSKMKPGLCFIPQYIAAQIQTPIFYVNPQYDSIHIGTYIPNSSYPTNYWIPCKSNLKNCSADQMKFIQHFKEEFLITFKASVNSCSRVSYFINGCYTHCQTEEQATWFQIDSPTINGTSIANAVGDWVYDLRSFEAYGPPYPFDRTCQNLGENKTDIGQN